MSVTRWAVLRDDGWWSRRGGYTRDIERRYLFCDFASAQREWGVYAWEESRIIEVTWPCNEDEYADARALQRRVRDMEDSCTTPRGMTALREAAGVLQQAARAMLGQPVETAVFGPGGRFACLA